MSSDQLKLDRSADRSRRLLAVIDQDNDVFGPPLADIDSMLDTHQLAAVHWLTRLTYAGGRLAELGTYTGGTTVAYGRALRALGAGPASLEVYDLFEHSEDSRHRLAAEEGSDDVGFFGVWQRRTADFTDLVDLQRGDFRERVRERTGPLEQVYVDIVKHESLINPLMHQVLPRLVVGGYLIHQDYFHWQSPWVVYSTELLMPHLEIVATVSNHMMILQLVDRPPMDLLQQDFLALDHDRVIGLMRAAMRRYRGIRRGLLHVSLINLAADWPELDLDAEVAQVRETHAGAERVQRYLESMLAARTAGAERPLW